MSPAMRALYLTPPIAGFIVTLLACFFLRSSFEHHEDGGVTMLATGWAGLILLSMLQLTIPGFIAYQLLKGRGLVKLFPVLGAGFLIGALTGIAISLMLHITGGIGFYLQSLAHGLFGLLQAALWWRLRRFFIRRQLGSIQNK